MAVSDFLYDLSEISPVPFILPQMRESHPALFLGERNVSLGDNVQVERANAFFKLIERNLGIQKGTQSPLQILLKHAVQFSDPNVNSPVIAVMKQAFFKQEGYLARLFSNETWEEWTENRTSLGKVAFQFRNCIESRPEVCSFTKVMNPQLIQKANEESSALLNGIDSREVTRTSKGSCLYGLTSGIAASFLLENPLPLLMGLSVCFPRAYAQQKVGTEFRVNTYTTYAQTRPSVASFSNGNFVVTWYSWWQDGSVEGVYVQLFDRNGTKIGSEFRANSYTAGAQLYPSVASFSNGNFVVTWQSNDQDGSRYGIYGQLFDGNGTKIGNEFQANSYVILDQTRPSVASLSNGNFVVTWHSEGQDGSDTGVFGQLFDGNGTKIGSEFQVNTYTTSLQWTPSGASFSNGNFVVTWASAGQDGSNWGIFGQLFDGNGSTIGSEFQANSYTTSNQRYPSAASFSNGNFVVTWQSNGQDGSAEGVYGQLFDGNGTKTGSEFRANTYTTDWQRYPSVASFSNGNFVVTWHSNGQDGDSDGVYGQLFDGNGTKIGIEFRANTYITYYQRYSSVASLADGKFIVTWASNQDGDSDGVYGQIFHDNITYPLSSTTTSPSTASTTKTTSSTTLTTSTISTTTLASSIRLTNLTTSTTFIISTTNTVSSSRLTRSTSSSTSTAILASSTHPTSFIPSSTSTAILASSTHPTSFIPSSTLASTLTFSSPKASSPPKRTGLITWISLGVGGLICFCITPLGIFLLRKRKSQTETRFGEAHLSSAFELEPVKQKSHTIIGRAYYQLSTLDREEAEQIYHQTGHLIPFPEAARKLSYVIGSGRFGKIKVAQRIEDRQFVASKKVKGAENMRASEAEAQMQQAASGANVLPIYNTIRFHEALYHFMPLAGLGDGSSIQRRLAILNQSPLAIMILQFIAQNILTGLRTIHAKGIFHLDMKPDNLVFTKDGTAYITDFGCAQRPESRHLTGKALGDNRYFSPERLRAFRGGTFDAEKADIWAAGVTLMQIFYNKGPLQLLNMPHRLAARVEKCDQAHFDEQLKKFTEVQEGSIWWVIRGLLDTNPKTRLSAEKALQARCFQGLDMTQQKRVFEDLRRETFAQNSRMEKSEVNLDNYGWVVQMAPEEEVVQGYSSERNQQFYGYTLTPDSVPPNYLCTPDHVTASSSASSGYQLIP